MVYFAHMFSFFCVFWLIKFLDFYLRDIFNKFAFKLALFCAPTQLEKSMQSLFDMAFYGPRFICENRMLDFVFSCFDALECISCGL